MPYYLGLDGGGTKTACLLVDGQGATLATAQGTGTSYRQHGEDAVLKTLESLAQECAHGAGASVEGLDGVCVGLPLYGENSAMDEKLEKAVQEMFPRALLVNDVQVGWAGSLACQPGINVVAGTGSIAFGCDAEGHTARSGGWSEHFSDEGSSYWLALRGMQLFTKQSDGRAPKGPLYEMVRKAFALEDDFDFVTIAEEQLLPARDRTAAFQRLVADAAKAGDAAVLPLYESAAQELAQLAAAVKAKLHFSGECVPVSYSGGTFQVGKMLLGPMGALLAQKGMSLQKPIFSPVQGAALLAVKHFAPDCFPDVLRGFQQ